MRKNPAKRILGVVLAAALTLQSFTPVAFAESTETYIASVQDEGVSDNIVNEETPVKIQTSESAATPESGDEQENSSVSSNTVFNVTIDINRGTLPAEWIETANGFHDGLNTQNDSGNISIKEDGDNLVVTVTGRESLYLMNPTPENGDEYFSGWVSDGGQIDAENSTLTFDPQKSEYTITAQYSKVEEESEQVNNAREYTEISEEDNSSGISFFALKPTDDYTKLDLAMEGLEFVYEDGQIQTFTAPYDGEYVITAYGANGGTGYAKYDGYGVPGRGGMTEATVTLKKGQTIYMYLGEAGGDWSTERTFGGGGAGVDEEHAWIGTDDNSLHIFGRGGGATYVSIDEFDMANAGQAPQDFTEEQQAQNDAAAEEAKKHIIMLAAGGGGAGEMGSPYIHKGLNGGGYEGGILYEQNKYYLGYEQAGMMTYDATVGGRKLTYEERVSAWLYPATQTRAGYGYHYSINGELYDPNPANKDPIEYLYPEREARNWGSFFFGSNAMACTGAGGGGWFGGGTDYAMDGGGGSSYIGTSVLTADGTEVTITDPETVAGANIKYDNTKTSPFYVNGRVLIKLKDGQAQIASVLQKAADEDISSSHIESIIGDEYGQTVLFSSTSSTSNETVGYTAVIYYTPGPDTVKVEPEWKYNTYRSPEFVTWNDSVAKAINPSLEVNINNQEIGVPQPGDKYYNPEYDGWNAIVSQMTISNVFLDIFDPSHMVAYNFKCGAVGSVSLSSGIKTIETETEEDGSLTTDYSISMRHMGVNTYNTANNINVAADSTPYNSTSLDDVVANTAQHEFSTWAYPELVVETPKTLRTFNVLFTSPSRNSNDSISYDADLAEQLGIVVTGTKENYIFTQQDGLNKDQWTQFLRTVTFTTYDPLIISADKVEKGVNIEWLGFEESTSGAGDKPVPQLSDYPNVINHDISKSSLSITSSGKVYHVTGSTTSNTIYVASGVTTTIFLDNVSITTYREGTGWGSGDPNRAGDGCIVCSHSNTTIVLMGTNTLRAQAQFTNCIAKNGKDGQLTIDGNGTLSCTGAGGHAGAISASVECSFWNFTQKNGTIIAHAGGHTAAIGSGCRNDSQRSGDRLGAGNIRFEGGTTYAYGSSCGAGIGSVYGAPVNGIYISNGAKVEAYGGEYSPGIGSGGRDANIEGGVSSWFYNVSNIVISGKDTVVTAFGDKATNMPGIGCGKDPLNSSQGVLSNVVAKTDTGFQGYVRYGSSEENAQYSTSSPTTPFEGAGNIGTYLASQVNAGKPVYYTQIFFSLSSKNKALGDADIIGTQVEDVKDYTAGGLPRVSGVVWAENDRDGVYIQGDEPVVSNVKVQLVTEAGTVAKTTTTNEAGLYTFTGVDEGRYKIVFEVPEGTIDGQYDVSNKPDASEFEGKVKNCTNNNWESDIFVSSRGGKIENVNCGIYVPSSISGFIWDDTNRNGIFDAGEEKAEGVTVSLQKNGNAASDVYGKEYQPIVTNKNGEYAFYNVPAGLTSYEVVITSGSTDIKNATVSPIPDSSTPAEQANTAYPITLGDVSSSFELEKAVIANLYIPSISKDLKPVNLIYKNCALSIRPLIYGYVWAETDYNGICDGFEAGNPKATTEQLLSNVEVTLKDKSGNPVSKTYTSTTGYYEFSNVAPGKYTVEFAKADGFTAGGKVSEDEIGFDPLLDTVIPQSVPDQIGNSTTGVFNEEHLTGLVSNKISIDSVSLRDASENSEAFRMNVNAGLFAPSAVSGLVWEDYNQDGIRTEDEELLNEVKVTLLKYTGTDVNSESSYSVVTANRKEATIQTGQSLDVISGTVKEGTAGTYCFNNLPTGIYAVRFESGDYDMRFYIVSAKDATTDETVDNDTVGTYTDDEEELISAFTGNISIPSQTDMELYGYENAHNDMGAYQKLRDVTVTKQIHASEIEWDHGTPTFMVTVYGTDQKGVLHEFNHAYEFTQEYVKENTDENGVVSMTYTFEGIPYARIYNVEEQNTSRYVLEQISGSENATFENETAILDLKYNVSGEVTFLNKVAHYRDTSANSLVINSLLAG